MVTSRTRPLSSIAMAPVGQISAAGLASRHRARSNSGLPRNDSETAAGVCGYFAVTTPVLKLFCRILNMSAIRARVREVETLVDHREVGDDVSLYGLDDRGPVVDGGVLDFAALQSIVGTGTHPVNDFAAPSLHRAE